MFALETLFEIVPSFAKGQNRFAHGLPSRL
jgi:hypothetical protein